MATREQALAAVFSEGKTLSVEDPNSTGTFLELPGLLDITEGDGSRDGRSAGTDSTRPTGVVSNMKAPTVEATFKYVSSPNWDVIDDAFINKTALNFRFDTEGETILPQTASGVTCAIAATGACTFAGYTFAADDFPLGADVVISSTHYPIASVSAAGAVSVKAPASAVTAAQFSVATPSERVSFRGKVSMTPTRQHGLAQQSEREGTLTIQCVGILPKPVRIV